MAAPVFVLCALDCGRWGRPMQAVCTGPNQLKIAAFFSPFVRIRITYADQLAQAVRFASCGRAGQGFVRRTLPNRQTDRFATR
jgi:hypothetical protein